MTALRAHMCRSAQVPRRNVRTPSEERPRPHRTGRL